MSLADELQCWAGWWIAGLGSSLRRNAALNWLWRECASKQPATAFTTGDDDQQDIQPDQPARWQMRQHPGNGAMMAHASMTNRPI